MKIQDTLTITVQRLGRNPEYKSRADRNVLYEVRVEGLREQFIKDEHVIEFVRAVEPADIYHPKTEWWQTYIRECIKIAPRVWHVWVFQEWLD